ncbi:predicted protein [Chaetoceros tenuissimus]|uniref:Uncharacterized protein n=1 Tax=Chaetoceros tenuissimus TaxID=426638 RepID=A0AAD3DES6_9STRA|nr:predicted protein [Chaetoceros tenuissimus]
MNKKQKITDYIDPVITATNNNGEYLHHHVFLAVDDRPNEQEEYDTLIRNQIVDLISSSWNTDFKQGSLPLLTQFRSDTVHNCIAKLRLHFANIESRISVDATFTKGHHPLFSRNMLHRTTVLDPSQFTKVLSLDFLELEHQCFRSALNAEMKANNNKRLQNFLIFNLDEDSKSYESFESNPERYVLSKGLTLHEIIVLYYTCSKRRSLVEGNWNALEKTFSYIHPDDLKKLIKEMDNFIATYKLDFHKKLKENQFFDLYMRAFFHMMLDPVEQGDWDYMHSALYETEGNTEE